MLSKVSYFRHRPGLLGQSRQGLWILGQALHDSILEIRHILVYSVLQKEMSIVSMPMESNDERKE